MCSVLNVSRSYGDRPVLVSERVVRTGQDVLRAACNVQQSVGQKGSVMVYGHARRQTPSSDHRRPFAPECGSGARTRASRRRLLCTPIARGPRRTLFGAATRVAKPGAPVALRHADSHPHSSFPPCLVPKCRIRLLGQWCIAHSIVKCVPARVHARRKFGARSEEAVFSTLARVCAL